MNFHEVQVHHFHARHSFTRKFCGCMSLRGGCAMACALWAGLHLYVAIMAFQETNPIFSNLNKGAMIVLGVISLLFTIIAFYDLFALFVESVYLLRLAHRATWMIVILFLLDFFASIVLFGIQKKNYESWCLSAYPDLSPDAFNCGKLWEDELKLAIAVYIILCVAYLYWATCLWSYAQKIHTVGREAAKALTRGPPLPPPPVPMHPPTMMPGMYNLKPKITVLDDGYNNTSKEHETIAIEYEQEDGQKSAAQIARILFKKMKDAWR